MAYEKENYQTVKESIHDVIRKAGDKSQNILFGDTDHRDNSLLAFVAKPDTMVALAESGVTHLCLEVPLPLQYLADEFTNGKIPRDEFMRDMDAQFMMPHNDAAGKQERIGLIADTISNAKKVGIATHFVDKSEGTAPVTPLQNAVTEGFALYLQQNNTSIQETIDAFHENGGNSELAKKLRDFIENHVHKTAPQFANTDIWSRYQEDLLTARIQGDQSLAQTINGIAKGEKTAIFYGSSHGMTNHQDLDDQLGAATAKIILQGKGNQEWYDGGTDKPDAVYDLVSGKTTVDKDTTLLTGMTHADAVAPLAETAAPRKPLPALSPQ